MDFWEQIKEAWEKGKEEGRKIGSLECHLEKVEAKWQAKQEEEHYQKDRLKQLKRDHVPC